MRHPLAAGLIVASTVAAAAQTSSQAPITTASPSAPAASKVTGCLAAGPAAHTFTLTTVEADLRPNPVGTSGVAGSPESGTARPEMKTVIYTLTPQLGVDLSAHIGHTVEVSGVEPPAKPVASATDQSRPSTPATLPSTTPRIEFVARRMRVSAVKMVAADCHIRK